MNKIDREKNKDNDKEKVIDKGNNNFKSGFIGFLGRTNVGKSTILNKLLKEKVSIVTPKKQTTRKQIKGILTTDTYQLIFLDTPGIHKGKYKLNKLMNETAYLSNMDVDLIIYVVEPKITDEDLKIIENLKKDKNLSNKPVILLINKIDEYKFGKDKKRDLELIDKYSKLYQFKSIIPISCKTNHNINQIIPEILKQINVGPKYFNKDEYTDQTEREIVEEVVREKALKLLREEIPHGIFVEVNKMKKRLTKNNEEIYDVDITINCVKDSHKGIIIGKDGEMLKKILTYAREDLEEILNIKLNMKVWVKVNKDWLDNEKIIKRFKSE